MPHTPLSITATGQYILDAPAVKDAGQLTFQTVGLTASCSVIPRSRPAGTGTANMIALPYTNVSTDVSVAAGTPITTDGKYQIAADGSELLLDATVSAGSALVYQWPTGGASGSGGGGGGGGAGGAITVPDGADVTLGSKADAAVTDYTLSASAIALLKGISEVLQGTGAGAVVPVRVQDGAGNTQPAGDTTTRPIFVTTQGQIADGSSGAAIPGQVVAGLDAGGLVRTVPVILGSSTPLTTAQYGIATYSMLAGASSANTLRGLATGSNYTDGGNAATSLVVLETRATGAATHERVFNNRDVSWLTSAARTTLQTLADATNQNYKGVTFFIDVTAFTSTVTLTVNIKDPVSLKYFPIGTVTIAGTGSYLLQIYPGAGTGSGNLTTTNASLTRTFNATITGSATYTAGYSLMV